MTYTISFYGYKNCYTSDTRHYRRMNQERSHEWITISRNYAKFLRRNKELSCEMN